MQFTDELTPNQVEQPFAVVDLLENSEEAEVFAQSREALSEADGVVSLVSGVDVLDDDLIAELESRMPGIVLDNVPYDIRYTSAGIEDVKKTAKEVQERMLVVSSVATITMIDKFAGFMRSLSGSVVNEGVVSSLLGIETIEKQLKMVTSVEDDSALMSTYQKFMGVKPESPDQVFEMIGVIKQSKSGLECLKKFPNDKYDKIFTPLLTSTISESSDIFSCFDKLNRTYARQLMDTIEKVKADMQRIMKSGDYDSMNAYSDSLIPDDIMKTMSEIIGSLGVQIDPRKGILKQTGLISKHMARMLKADEDSLRKKASVVNAIVYRYKELDKAFKDISEATQKLSEYTKEKDVDIKELRLEMRKFKMDKSFGKRAKDLVKGNLLKHGQTHHRIMNELDDVWALVGLMVRMSISYATTYSVLKITLDKFKKSFADFTESVNKLSAGEGEIPSKEQDKPSEPTEDNDDDDSYV